MAKKKSNTKWWIICAVVLIGLVAAVIIKNKNQDKGLSVEIEKVEARTIEELVEASGKVFPEIEIKISSSVSGEVVELYVEEGDSVRAGQLLAIVDPEEYESAVERVAASVDNSKAQLANSKAGLEQARAQKEQMIAQKEQIKVQVDNQKKIHERNAELKAKGVVSLQDFEASLASLHQLEANMRSAEANLRSSDASMESARQTVKAAEFGVKGAEATLNETRTSLRKTKILAGMSGVVSSLNVEKGETVVGSIQMTGTEMMRIADMRSMEVRVDVSENDVLLLEIGDEVNIEVDAYIDEKFKGKVTEIANTASNALTMTSSTDQVTNFEVKVRIDAKSYKHLINPRKPFPFRPGMSAAVEIVTERKEGILTVPIQSVTTRAPKKDENEKEVNKKDKDKEDEIEVVFVDENGKAKMVPVKTGIQDDTYIEVLKGLSLEDEVVSGPYTAISKKLKDGKAISKKEKKDWKENDDDDED